MKKTVEILEVQPDADFDLLIGDAFKGEVPDQLIAKKKDVREDVLEFLSSLTISRMQMLIRLYGLDGKGRRTHKQVAREMNSRLSLVIQTQTETLNSLQVHLLARLLKTL